MSTDRSDPALEYTLPFQLTKKIHRDVPALLDPKDPKNSADGKIIVITGGGSGIGAATARIWVLAGAAGVVIAGRRKELLAETAAELEELAKGATKIVAVPVDVAKEADTENLFAQVNKVFGRPADVVLANAGIASAVVKPHEDSVASYWSVFETNVLGLHNMAVSWIKSQPDPSNAVGTLVSVNSNAGLMTAPGLSGYCISKLASERYIEFLHVEYPSLRVFSIHPGIVPTPQQSKFESFKPYAKDKGEQTGALLLYLSSPRSDYLRGSLTSVNWDIEEMEEHKQEIEDGLLKLKFLPVLPCGGGSGL